MWMPSDAVRRWFSGRLVPRSAGRQWALLCVLAGLCVPVGSFAQSARRHNKQPGVVQAEEQRQQQTAPEAEAAPIPAPAASPVLDTAPPTLEHQPSRLPTVTFNDGALTIVAYNSTLRDVLEAVRSQTGADIEIPPKADERVIVSLGPGPARRVLDSLLAGSAFNYVMLGSAADPGALAKVILSPKPNDAADMAGAQRAAHVSPYRAMARSQAAPEPVDEVEEAAPVKEAVAGPVAKPEDAAKPASAAAPETPGESAPQRASVSQDDYPHTPNIRSAQEVLQDLYARRRQITEQQNQQPRP